MKILIDPKEPLEFSTVAAIGNFDGVHKGHKSILRILNEKKDFEDSKSCIITFDPHPQKVLGKKEISLILPLKERFNLLGNEGIDCIACFNFTKTLSDLDAQDFVKEILIKTLRIKDIIVGPDFMFGKNRSGNSKLLTEMGEKFGFKTTIVDQENVDGEVVSSSLIRQYINNGQIGRATDLLGYRYYIKGMIIEGEKRGRQLGFPTINLDTNWELLPKLGVYATYTNIEGKKYQSITNVGYRPTFDENKLLIETHIFDFSEDVYNKTAKVEFVERLRDEKKFSSVESLIDQIKIDIENVKVILSNN